MPARTVEQDARQRLGRTLRQTGDDIEQALAVRIPSALAKVNQSILDTEIERTQFEFCILSGDSNDPNRWPEKGWLQGTINYLATNIELAALSENRIARGMQVLEDGIDLRGSHVFWTGCQGVLQRKKETRKWLKKGADFRLNSKRRWRLRRCANRTRFSGLRPVTRCTRTR